MAKNINISSATFDGQAMRHPVDYRVAALSETVEDSAGIDTLVSSNESVNGRVEIQVLFKDWNDARSMLTSKWQVSGTLTINTRQEHTTTDLGLTITNARCRDVFINAGHNEKGTHVAIFVARSTNGSTIPVS